MTDDISLTVLYEDNAACVTQMSNGYVKGNLIKHIAPKFFYSHELQKKNAIIVEKVRSRDNLVDLFTKSIPTSTLKNMFMVLECVDLENCCL